MHINKIVDFLFHVLEDWNIPKKVSTDNISLMKNRILQCLRTWVSLRVESRALRKTYGHDDRAGFIQQSLLNQVAIFLDGASKKWMGKYDFLITRNLV